jgi:hypothetical protein
MFDAFRAGSSQATFVALPDFEADGHAIFWKASAMPLWIGQVGQVLDRIIPAR